MFVAGRALCTTHQNSKECRDGVERKQRRLEIAATSAAHEVTLKSQADDLGSVDVFKYLGRLLTYNDDDWPAISGNIKKARAK